MKRKPSMQTATVDDRMRAILRRLRYARQTAGISQKEAADAAGIHRPALSLIERGGQPVTVELLLVLAITYGFTPEYLLGCSADTTNPALDPHHGNLCIFGSAAPIPEDDVRVR